MILSGTRETIEENHVSHAIDKRRKIALKLCKRKTLFLLKYAANAELKKYWPISLFLLHTKAVVILIVGSVIQSTPTTSRIGKWQKRENL
jgi:hypothetical protein